MAVLDRGLCNDAWFNFFDDCTQKTLPRHAPILIKSEDIQRPNNIPFRMRRFWIDHKDFSEVVSQSWNTPVNGTPIFIVVKKLNRLKADLKNWAKLTFPRLNNLVKSITIELEHIQETIENVGSNGFLLDQELEAKSKLHNALEIREKLWAKKSRIKWLKCGDRNTKFFHLTTKIRQAKNFMRKIKKQDGSIISDTKDIGNYVAEFYENFHKKPASLKCTYLLNCIPLLIDQNDNHMLTTIPSEDEIKSVVFVMDFNNSLGPVGFPGTFYQKCWYIVGFDVCRAIRNVF
ncbi:hypothetical protein AMTRI_Chr08g163930 [Amborella trichopoda]